MKDDLFIDGLNDLDSENRRDCDYLHSLRLVYAKGGVRMPNKDLSWDGALKTQVSQGYLDEGKNGGIFGHFQKPAYLISQRGRDILEGQRGEAKKVDGLAKGRLPEEAYAILKDMGYQPAASLAKGWIVNGKFDREEYGLFSREQKLGEFLFNGYSKKGRYRKSDDDFFFGSYLWFYYWPLLDSDHNCDLAPYDGSNGLSDLCDSSDVDSGDCGGEDSGDFGGGDFGGGDCGGGDCGGF